MTPAESVDRLAERAQDLAKEADEAAESGNGSVAIVLALRSITNALLAIRLELATIADNTLLDDEDFDDDDEDDEEFIFQPETS